MQKVQQHVKQLGTDAAKGEEGQIVVVGADQSVAPSKRRRCLVVLVDNAVPCRSVYLGVDARSRRMRAGRRGAES